MGYSLNTDINCGSKKFHIQTEFYKSSGMVVTNIFLDGNIVKRIEKEPETDIIEKEIEKQHKFVIDKLNAALKDKLECSRKGQTEEKSDSRSEKSTLFKPGKHILEKILKEKPGKGIVKKIMETHPGENTFKKTKKFLDTLFDMLKD